MTRKAKFYFLIIAGSLLNAPFLARAQFIPPPPPSFDGLSSVEDETLKEGDLVRAKSDFRVYRIIKNQKHWIINPSVFASYGLSWNKIKIVEQEILDTFPKSYLIRLKGDPRVYYINTSGLKKHIINERVFYSYNNRWEDIIEVNKTEFDSYETVKLIRAVGDSRVFLLDGIIKRHIVSPAVFERLRLRWDKVLEVNAFELNEYLEGSSIQ